MEGNEIYPRINNNINEFPEYLNLQSNNEKISFDSKDNKYKSSSYYTPYYSTQISPEKYKKPVNSQILHSSSKNNYNPNYYNPNNQFNSENNDFNENNNFNLNKYRTLSNKNASSLKNFNNNNFPQNISPTYLDNNKYNSILNYNNSQLYNGYTTDEGESFPNYNNYYNRDSNYYNQNSNQYISIINPDLEDEKANTYDTNDEQLIIYPDNKYSKNKFINDKEKYYNPITKEGKLKPKNYETYEINYIEDIPENKRKNKPISLGDYIIKKPDKDKLRKTRSCDNISITSDNSDSNYNKIKFFTNKNKDSKNKIKKTPAKKNIYNIKTIKDKSGKKKDKEKEKELGKNKKREKKISKVLEHFGGEEKNFFINNNIKNIMNKIIKVEENEGDGGIVDIGNQKDHSIRYNTKYKINKNNFKLIKYPKWKTVASACLIQSWWRSLKLLYNNYLQKIIIIQKVYRIHYRNKNSLKGRKKYLYPKKIDDKTKDNVLPEPGNYKKNKATNKIKKLNSIDKNKFVYNKPNRSQFERHQSEFSFSSRNSLKNKYNIGMLLLKKIIENNLFKTYKDVLSQIKENNDEKMKIQNAINEHKKLFSEKNKKFNKLTFNNDEKNKLMIIEDNLKPINVYAKKNDNYVNLKIIASNNIVSFTYKPDKDLKNKINTINNVNSFSICKENNNKEKNLLNKYRYKRNELYNGNNNDNNNKINNYTFHKDENEITNDDNKKDTNKYRKINLEPRTLSNLRDKNNKNIENYNPSYNNTTNAINITNYSKDSSIYKKDKNKDSCNILLNDKYKKLLYPIRNDLYSIQSFLLKKIVLKLWEKKTFKDDKNTNKKNKDITPKNSHVLLCNLMKYVFDKIKKEVKRRKLIVCFKNINMQKYPNLRYALKKIKKFAKVRYKVMNEYASIIQNAFRYYLENKNKEQNQEIRTNDNKNSGKK